MLVIYVNSFNRRSGEDGRELPPKEGRELPPSSSWRQFPALLSAPAVEPKSSLTQYRKIEILNKTDCGNISIAP